MKLEGVKVLDLSMFLPGPHLTMMMADHRADVISVEPPSPWKIPKAWTLPSIPAPRGAQAVPSHWAMRSTALPPAMEK